MRKSGFGMMFTEGLCGACMTRRGGAGAPELKRNPIDATTVAAIATREREETCRVSCERLATLANARAGLDHFVEREGSLALPVTL